MNKQIESEEEWIKALAEKAQTPPTHVLLVEDDSGVQECFRALTAEFNIKLDVYGDGETALANFWAGKFDVIFLDLRLPRMSGVELYKIIHSMDTTAFIAIISAYISEKVREEIKECGIAVFIDKPMDFNLAFIRDFFTRIGIQRR